MKVKIYVATLFAFLLLNQFRVRAQCGDHCSNATPLTVTATGPCNYVTCTNTTASGSTPSGVPTLPCSGVNNNDVWYTFTVPAGVTSLIGQVQGGPASGGNMEYPIIYFYRGGCTVLTQLGCNTGTPPGSTASLQYTAFIPGEVILVRVKPLGGTSDGNFQICVYNPCPSGPPANDNPCSATVVPMSGGTVCGTYTNLSLFCATGTAGPPTPFCGNYLGNDIWVQTTVGANGHLGVSFQPQSLYNPAAAIYTGTCSSLTQVACDDDAGGSLMPYMFVTSLTPNSTAWIRIWASGSLSNVGTVGICLNDPCPGGSPPGDDPCSAIPLAASAYPCSTFYSLSNVCAGGSSGMSPPGCASYAGGDVWVVTTSASGRLEVNFQELSLYDVGAAIYTGTCSTLALVACDDDNGPGAMPYLFYNSGIPNTTYFIRIWDYGGNNTGTTSLCVTDPCPGNTLTPPLYDDPLAMCPAPALTNQLPVTNGSCINYITLNSICAAPNVSTVPPNVPVPTGCGPFYPAGAFTGWDVWATVTVPTVPPAAFLDFNTMYGSLYNIDMAVYRVSTPAAANCSTGTNYTLIACADYGGPGNMPYLHIPYGGANVLQPGDTLYVRMWHNYGGPAGDWGICINTSCPGGTVAPPGYDDPPCPTNAQLLPVNGGTCVNFQRADIDNCLSATSSAPAPSCAYWNNGNDLWFVVQMPLGGSGQLDFNFEDALSLYDPGMAIYSGLPVSCGGTGLTQIACDDDGGNNLLPYISLTNPVAPGQYLYVRIWAYGGYSTGTIGLCVSDPCPSQPVNDLRCNATPLALTGTCNFNTFPLICANNIDNTGVPAPGCGQPFPTTGTGPGRDIWFSFIAPASGNVIIDTREGSLTNIDMALYRSSSGSACVAGFILVACDDNSGIGEMPYLSLSNLVSGTTYYLRVWEHDNDQDGNFSICIFNPCPSGAPANDNICNATFVALNNSITGNNNCARFDPGITNLAAPPPACWVNAPPFNTVANMNTSWYKTTGSSNYTILVTPNTIARPQVAVYSGAVCGLITAPLLRACDAGLPGGCKSTPNASIIELSGMLASDTIFIVVEGADNRMGTFEIAVYNTLLSGIHAVSFLDCNQAVPICAPITSVANPGRLGGGNHCDLGTSFAYRAYESAAGANSSSTTVTVNSTAGLSVGMTVSAIGGGTFRPGTRITSIPNDTQFVVSAVPQVALTSATSAVYGFIDPSYVSGTGALSSGTTITVGNTAGLYPGMTVTSAGGSGGNFPAGTTVLAVLSNTQFTVSNAPVPAFSGTTVVTGTRYLVDNRYPEANASWYFFSTTSAPGNIAFNITSNGNSNYDFVLWELTGAAAAPGFFTGMSTPDDSTVCALIRTYTGYGLPLRTNVSNTSSASTGLSNLWATDAAFSQPVPTSSVRTFILVVMNTEGNSQGFNLDFGTSPINFSTPAVIWNGGAGTNDWFEATNWGDCAIPQCNVSAIVVGGMSNQPVIASNATVNNLTIQAGSSLSVGPGVTLVVCGNFTNSGDFRTDPSSVVKFTGAGAQTISGNFNGLNQFANLTIEKATNTSVTLGVNADIAGTLRISTPQSIFDVTGKYIRLGGDFFNANGNASFVGQAGTTLELNGTGVQTFTNLRNGGPESFFINNIVINQQDPFNDYVELSSAGGGTTDNSLRIGSTLSLIGGKIFTNQWEVYSLNSQPGSVSGGNDNAYIEGVHSRNVSRASTPAAPYIFAIGSGGSMEYAGIVKYNAAALMDTIKLRASFTSWPGAVPYGPVSNECQGADWSLFEAYDHGYWRIDSIYSSGPAIGQYTLNLRPAPIVSNNSGSASWSIMKRSPSGTGSWMLDGSCRTGPVFSAAYDVYRDSMSGFSDFAITQYNVAIVGIQDREESIFRVFPSATDGPVTILASPSLSDAEYTVTDVCGKRVRIGQLRGESTMVDLHALSPGMYFLWLNGQPGDAVKLLKY